MKASDILSFIKAEAFLISAVPAVAIVISFFFEIGYLRFYGVPIGVVEIDIYKIIISIMCLIAFFYFVVEIFYIVLKWAGGSNKFVSIFWVSMIPGMIIALFSLLYRIYFLLWFAAGVWFICYLYVWFLMVEREKNKKDLSGSKEDSLANKIKVFLTMSALAVGLSFGVGYNVALDKVSYFVVNNEKVLVEIYGGRAVLAYFVKKEEGAFLTGEVEVTSLGDYQLKGEYKRLGKITPVETLIQKKD